jgi:hypothetical protein
MANQDETVLDEDSESFCHAEFNFTETAISLTGACKSLMLARGFLACHYRATEVKEMS